MAKHEDPIETELGRLETQQGFTTLQDQRTVPSIFLLTKAVIRLDKTSSRLAKIYIWLTVILGIIGVVQIVLMLRGH
jgi:hypothetical protein